MTPTRSRRFPTLRRWLGATALVGLVAGAGFSAPAGAAVSSVRLAPHNLHPDSQPLVPPPIPTTGAYLGAWVDPGKKLVADPNSTLNELAQLSDFQASIGRPVAIVHAYQSWNQHIQNQTLAALSSTGAIPMIDWDCGDLDSNIINATGPNPYPDDTMITTFALQLLQYGRPVFLRWYWEPNLLSSQNSKNCLGSAGAVGYAQTFRHIVNIFHNLGVNNVAFVWCPSISGSQTQLKAFYPGDNYVDWIGIDGYDRHPGGTGQPFVSIFNGFYKTWASKDKPMMVAETGAPSTKAGAQPSYLDEIASVLPTQFPLFKAVVYFDGTTNDDWALTSGTGTNGISAYTALGQNSYFSVMP